MFVELTKSKIVELITKNEISSISRWDTIEKANNYYSHYKSTFVGYIENVNNLTNAYSTPVFVYLVKNKN